MVHGQGPGKKLVLNNKYKGEIMKKKLMILLIATLFLTMMFSTGCKKKFDITGTWTIIYDWHVATNSVSTDSTISSMNGAAAAGTATVTFTGDRKTGTFTTSSGYTGTYNVTGNDVNWVYTSGTTYTGTSSDDNHMSGTMVSYKGFKGTWTCTRQSKKHICSIN